MTESVKDRLQAAVKDAMRAGDRTRLGTLRMLHAAVKQREVDDRRELDEAEVLAVLDKQIKQRRESAEQYREAGRVELAEREEAEIGVLSEFLPRQLTEAELDQLIERAVRDSGAQGMRDMGKVMGLLKGEIQGRADMGAVSRKVKARLGT